MDIRYSRPVCPEPLPLQWRWEASQPLLARLLMELRSASKAPWVRPFEVWRELMELQSGL